MKYSIYFFILFVCSTAHAQLGGTSVYEFVKIPYSARENALGGECISLNDGDVSLALKNPSLLDTSYSYAFSGTWGGFHIAQTNIGAGSFACAYTVNPKVTALAGIQFINYGRFFGYDEDGNYTGTFFGSDYQIILGGSYQLHKHLYGGVSIKPILSYLESYSSYGLLGDIALHYKRPEEFLSISLIARNIGTQITSYTSQQKESVPYSIDLGITKRLQHAPLRFTISYLDIQQFNLDYDNILKQKTNLINQEQTSDDKLFTTIRVNTMKHLQFSAELLLFKHIDFLLGYNYRNSEEMSFGASKKGTGISAGARIKTPFAHISYGWSKQHVAGGLHFISLTTNIQTIVSKFTPL
ncbi:MAG TPA: type IX secretion system protein PorQ [Bacteroidales bacterium]|nr:type IX secretion system protein PorQ [Bacteroidales bacterium]HPM12134.1 type IX secretion system protein PorQ [Bacteroidales bacterium]